MNEIVNKFLLAGDEFIPEMYLRQLNLHMCLWTIYEKQKQNTKVYRNRRLTIYLLKQTREILFSKSYSL